MYILRKRKKGTKKKKKKRVMLGHERKLTERTIIEPGVGLTMTGSSVVVYITMIYTTTTIRQ